MHSRQELAAHLGGKAFQAASSAMEASMLWRSCSRSRESFSRYTRLFRTAAAYWEKVVSWLLLAASAASLVRLAAHPEPGKAALQAQQANLTRKGGVLWGIIALLQLTASAA